jgi:hypothetical protein
MPIYYVFSTDPHSGEISITTTDSSGPVPLVQTHGVPTAISLLDMGSLIQRFFCDIIKDSQTQTKVPNIINILRGCFYNNVGIPQQVNQYADILARLEAQLLQNETIKGQTTVLKNILKSSTVGTNTQISDATHTLWESGFSSKDVCRNPHVTHVRTSAATLDPISKDKYEYLFNENVQFDLTFTQRLGFVPNITWQNEPVPGDKTTSYVTISFGPAGIIQGPVGNISPPDRGVFSNYCLGNNQKNGMINMRAISGIPTNCHEIIKLLLMKELGDVAQVWMYLAFAVVTGHNTFDARQNYLMITTDNVVYILCLLLQLSCMNTGSREGVQSGCCTLKHHLVHNGISYVEKLKNMMDVHKKRVLQNNNSIKFGLRIIQTDLSSAEYYVLYGDKLRRTVAHRGVPNGSPQQNAIKDFISQTISNIEARNVQLEMSYNSFAHSVVSNRLKNIKFHNL